MAPIDGAPLLTSTAEPYRFSIEPAHNLFYSLLMLNRPDYYPGLDEWAPRTVARLTPDRLHRNRVVVEGLNQAVQPARSYPSFLAYLDALAATSPAELRERQLRTLAERRRELGKAAMPGEPLASLDAYLAYLTETFGDDKFDPEIESEAYALLSDPARMHEVILEHLRTMWADTLRAEWERARPVLQEAVQAFGRVDLRGLAPLDAIRTVIGRELDETWCHIAERVEHIIFVPSPHLGPYVGKLRDGGTLRLLFGARQPDGIAADRSALSRSELLVRLGALTDDTRLRVLALLAEREELCAPEIMVQLDLSQSAVSRHLRQLSAAGYVSERWQDGSKCYQLNRDRIGDTLAALRRFLGAP